MKCDRCGDAIVSHQCSNAYCGQKENHGKTMEVLDTRVKIFRRDELYLDCPWCGSKVNVPHDRLIVMGVYDVECRKCGLDISVKEVEQ